MRTAAWSDTCAWGFTPDVKRSAAGKPICTRSQVPIQTPSSATTDRLAFLGAAACASIGKCEGGEAVIVMGVQGKCLPVFNPIGAMDRSQQVSFLINEMSDIFRMIPGHHESQDRAAIQSTMANANKQNPPLGTIALMDAPTFDELGADTVVRAFDAAFVLSDTSSHVEVVCNGQLFAAVHISDRADLVLEVADSMCKALSEDVPLSIAELPSTTASMRQRLLCDWQSKRIPVSQYHRTMVDLFLDGYNACENPETSLAVYDVATGRSITYSALLKRARSLAQHLLSLMPSAAWGTAASCGLHLPRGAEWHTVSIGVLMAGGTYLSLDPSFPTDRLTYSLEDSESVCIFTRRETADVLDFDCSKIIVDDAFWAEIDAMDTPEDFEYRAMTSTPAYLLYTSGSTGKPKGVCVENDMVVNFITGYLNLLGDDAQKLRSAQCSTMSFDMSVIESWPAFAAGQTVVTIEREMLHDTELLTQVLREQKITLLSATPTLLSTLSESALESVRCVVTGGEACPQDVVTKISRPGRRLINAYGPTEITVCCAATTLNPGDAVTIGRGLIGYFLCIVNSAMELLPPGVPGELCVASPSVARGYVKRDDLTEQKFQHCPFVAEPPADAHYDEATAADPRYQRLYHTGDLCRFNTDGKIEFLGRIDLQVKLRGFRIEIEEIESVLQSFPGVELAIVAKREQNGVEFLCGYVQCTQQHARPTDQELSAHLRKKLPSYMVPQRYMFVDDFVRTPAQKVDRKALPEPPVVASTRQEKTVRTATTATERTVLEVFTSIFPQAGAISIDDNFFDDLGGTSILAGRALTGLRKRSLDLSVRVLYTNPTIALLARHFDGDSGTVEPPQPGLPSAFRRPSNARRFFIGVWQLFFSLVAVANMWLFLIPLQYMVVSLGLNLKRTEIGVPIVIGTMLAGVVALVQLIFLALFLPLLKWLIIQRRKPGQYWIYSWYGVRWWTVRALYDAFPAGLYSHMNIVGWMHRLTGASIGHGCFLPATFTESDLLTIGDDVYIAPTAQLLTSQVIDQQLVLKPIYIGNGVSIEACATVEGGAIVPDRCLVRPLATVSDSHALREGSEWVTPGVEKGDTPPLPRLPSAESGTALLHQSRPSRPSFAARFAVGTAQVFLFIVTYTIITAAHFTVVYSMVRDGQAILRMPWYQGALAVLVAGFGAIAAAVWFILMSALCSRLTLPGCHGFREGSVASTSLDFHRWFMFQRVYLMSCTFYPVLSTVFGPSWARAIGIRVGDNVQFGLVASITPGLTSIGSDAFVADFATLNPPTVQGGFMTFRPLTVGDESMIGNNSVVDCKYIGDQCMVGAVTYLCEDLPSGKMALGAPNFISDRAPGQPPMRPSRCVLWLHALHNTADLVGGQWITFLAICLGIGASGAAKAGGPLLELLLFVVILEIVKTVLLVFFKWCLNGRLRPVQLSLQEPSCWRHLSQFALMLSILPFGVLLVLRGSVLYPWVLRMLGMKVGSNCYIDTFQIPETDLAMVESDSSINANVTLGTHAAEDGIMKFGRVRVGRRVTLMSGAVIAPSAQVGHGCSVAANSSVSKGERLDDRTHWAGMAVTRVSAPPILNVSKGAANVGGYNLEMKDIRKMPK